MDSPERDLVKVAVAARRLGIGTSKAYAMVKAGEMPGVVRIGGMLRVSLRALDSYIDEQASRPAATPR